MISHTEHIVTESAGQKGLNGFGKFHKEEKKRERERRRERSQLYLLQH